MREGNLEVLSSVLMSSASAEAFINEIDYLLRASTRRPSDSDATGILMRTEGSFRQKYEKILGGIIPDFSWKDEPFWRLSLLHDLRNQIVHLNHVDEFARPDESSPTEILLPQKLQKFYDLNLLRKFPKETWHNWFDLIKTERMAWWACKAARDSIIKVLKDSPQDLSKYFSVWRKFASEDLPPLSPEKKVEKKKDIKFVLYQGMNSVGKVAYRISPNREIIFSAVQDATSSINAAPEIIEAICTEESLDFRTQLFYDLQTHLGYESLENGEYILNYLRVHPGAQMSIEWVEVMQARIMRNREPILIDGSEEDPIARYLEDFKPLIGEAVPF